MELLGEEELVLVAEAFGGLLDAHPGGKHVHGLFHPALDLILTDAVAVDHLEMTAERGIAERDVLQEFGKRAAAPDVGLDDLLHRVGYLVGEALDAAVQDDGEELKGAECDLRFVARGPQIGQEIVALVEQFERKIDVADGSLRIQREQVAAHRPHPGVVLVRHVFQLQVAGAFGLGVIQEGVVRFAARGVLHEMEREIKLQPVAAGVDQVGMAHAWDPEKELAGAERFADEGIRGNFTGKEVERDGNIITARSMAYSIPFALEIIDYLVGPEVKEKVLIGLQGQVAK